MIRGCSNKLIFMFLREKSNTQVYALRLPKHVAARLTEVLAPPKTLGGEGHVTKSGTTLWEDDSGSRGNYRAS